jgi:hypothetical protein
MRRREFITLLGGVAATAIWSRVAHAQRTGRVPTVGVLWHAASAEEEGPYFRALIEGLRALGHAEGRNIKFEHRFPNEMPERFKSMAAELVSLNVDVLASVGNVAAPYAKNATLRSRLFSCSSPTRLRANWWRASLGLAGTQPDCRRLQPTWWGDACRSSKR